MGKLTDTNITTYNTYTNAAVISHSCKLTKFFTQVCYANCYHSHVYLYMYMKHNNKCRVSQIV